MVWLGPSLERRRLRFSFQFNDVKDPDRLRRPHCLAPVAGGGGYLGGRPVPVNQTFQSFFRTAPDHPEPSKSGRHPNLFATNKPPKTKGFQKSVPAAIRPGRRLSRGPPQPRQPGFFSFFSEGPEDPENSRKRVDPQSSSPPANPSDPRDLSSSPRRRPVRGGGCLGPS